MVAPLKFGNRLVISSHLLLLNRSSKISELAWFVGPPAGLVCKPVLA